MEEKKSEKRTDRDYIHHEVHDEDTVKSRIMSSLREIVFGIQDGIVSTLGAVTGIAAGVNNTSFVILSGFVVIVVESLSMAAGTYLSSKSEREVEERMLREEAEEIEDFPEHETEELREFYRERGFEKNEIEIIVNRITKDKELWLEEMAHKELGIIPQPKGNPVVDSLFMGFSYVVGGAVPVSVYFFLPIALAVPVSIVLSVVVLFLVGYGKGSLVKTKKLRSGLEMMTVSLVAAGLGYIVGRVMSFYFGIDV